MPPLPPITQALMLICTAVFCLQYIAPYFMTKWFALFGVTSGLFMPWQLLTYAFLHADVMHLFFNMMGLWMFGSQLEELWGRKRFVQFLLASVLAAALMQLLFSLVSGRAGATMGASGGLFGLLLAFAMLFPNRVIMLLFPPIPLQAKYAVAFFGALELIYGVLGVTGVAHFAHLGGMLGGFLMIRYWRGQTPFGRRRR